MTRLPFRSFVVALALCAAACKTPYQKKLAVPPGLKLSAVAVYPFGFRWGEKPYRSFEVSQRILRTALQGAADRALFFGPSEFRVYRPEDDNAWAATDLVALLPPYNVRPEHAAVLRPWAERRVHTSQKELYDAKGRGIGLQTVQETTYVAHLELLHPSDQTLLVEVIGEAVVDPFAEKPEDDADPAPELTALVENLTREAFKAVDEALAPPVAPKPMTLSYAFNPQEALRFTEGGQPSLELELAKMDALEGDVLKVNRVKFANPGMDDTLASKLTRLAGGLYVLEPSPTQPLQVGDLVMALEGQAALPQALHRARFLPAPLSARVRRASGEFVDLKLP